MTKRYLFFFLRFVTRKSNLAPTQSILSKFNLSISPYHVAKQAISIIYVSLPSREILDIFKSNLDIRLRNILKSRLAVVSAYFPEICKILILTLATIVLFFFKFNFFLAYVIATILLSVPTTIWFHSILYFLRMIIWSIIKQSTSHIWPETSWNYFRLRLSLVDYFDRFELYSFFGSYR